MSTKKPIAPIKAVLFDMDGLLLDSESIYNTIANKVLSPYGKTQTWEIQAKMMGKPEYESTRELFDPSCPFTIDSFNAAESHLLSTAFSSVAQMPGAARLVRHLARHHIPICIATGSSRASYARKTVNHPDLFGPFGQRVICSDDPRLTRGKPHPDIFLLAARHGLWNEHDSEAHTQEVLGEQWTRNLRQLGPEHDGEEHLKGQERSILVFEDGMPGVTAAKAAGMHVVWVPDHRLSGILSESAVGASQTIQSLLDFDPTDWGLPPFDENQ